MAKRTGARPSGARRGDARRIPEQGELHIAAAEKQGISPAGVILTRWKSLVRIQCRPLDLHPARKLPSNVVSDRLIS
jgi:hypothetical protein